MNEINNLIEVAEKKLSNVDHLLLVTFPVINDPKLLAPIAESLANCAFTAIEALLKYERAYKRIHSLPNNLDIMFNIFESEVVNRYKLSKNIIIMLNDLKNLLQSRKKSAVEFVKNDRYIICSNEYYTTIITQEKLITYKELTSKFINQIKEIVSRRS